jgi:hypothetical protein
MYVIGAASQGDIISVAMSCSHQSLLRNSGDRLHARQDKLLINWWAV